MRALLGILSTQFIADFERRGRPWHRHPLLTRTTLYNGLRLYNYKVTRGVQYSKVKRQISLHTCKHRGDDHKIRVAEIYLSKIANLGPR